MAMSAPSASASPSDTLQQLYKRAQSIRPGRPHTDLQGKTGNAGAQEGGIQAPRPLIARFECVEARAQAEAEPLTLFDVLQSGGGTKVDAFLAQVCAFMLTWP